MAEVSYSGYGKNEVRLMRVRRDGEKYFVTELKMNVELQLATTQDYEEGNNSDVVATDSQKNTIMALAKQNTIESPEKFGLLLCKHFLTTYQQVIRCQVYMEQAPWQRIKQGGAEHYHAFILEPSAIRFCCISESKGAIPNISGGLKDMKLFKTTQSGFEGFIRDKFTSLPETKDRSFCTNVYLKYNFNGSATRDTNYNGVWEIVKNAVLDVFAGPPYSGTYSPSIQNTMFETSKMIFSKVAAIQSVDMEMPNIHYFVADLKKINVPNTGELLLPSDAPRGKIAATFRRKLTSPKI